MKVVGVEGYNIRKVGKDKYSVAVNNGNAGACLMNREELDAFVAEKGGKIKESSAAKKAVLGLLAAGAVVAAILLSKKSDVAVEGLKSFKFDGVKEFAGKAKEFAKNAFKSAKEGIVKVAKAVWTFVKEKGKIVIDWVAEKGKAAFEAVKGFFSKKPSAA